MAAKLVYFSVSGKEEQAEFRVDDSPEDVKGRSIIHYNVNTQPVELLELLHSTECKTLYRRPSRHTVFNRISAYLDIGTMTSYNNISKAMVWFYTN